jgi:hypothetical protein
MPDKDLPPDNGLRSPGTRPDDTPTPDAAGTGPGYSGQEYDQPGQRAWREADDERRLPVDGVIGSGVGAGGGAAGEDLDEDAAGGSGS